MRERFRYYAARCLRRAVLAVLVGGALLGGAATAAAQSGEALPPGVTWDDVNRIARQMFCDVCEGIPLDECESIACVQWREEIARQLGEGRTDDEIIDYFVERYGAEVAAIPRDPVDRLIAFAVPFVIVALFTVVGAFEVRRLRRRGQQAGQIARRSGMRVQTRPVPADVDPQLIDRIESELEGLEA